MVAGDVVNFISGVAFTYQPSAGVEIVIMKNHNSSNTFAYGLTNGVTTATNYFVASSLLYDSSAIGNKVCITNTNYYTNSSASGTGFSGIQIK
jgi:hypothetical protein